MQLVYYDIMLYTTVYRIARKSQWCFVVNNYLNNSSALSSSFGFGGQRDSIVHCENSNENRTDLQHVKIKKIDLYVVNYNDYHIRKLDIGNHYFTNYLIPFMVFNFIFCCLIIFKRFANNERMGFLLIFIVYFARSLSTLSIYRRFLPMHFSSISK